jgi:CPA1 family monovalent cation:H+ antiporter
VIAWAGVRGAVSLAAALALPTNVPQRDTIVFITFAVILFSLIGPVVTLPGVVRLIGIDEDDSASREDAKARIKAAQAALGRLEELVSEEWVRDDTAERLRGAYRFRTNRFHSRFDPNGDGALEERSQSYQRLRRELLDAEREAVIALRNDGSIKEDVVQRVLRDIDLEDYRLDL